MPAKIFRLSIEGSGSLLITEAQMEALYFFIDAHQQCRRDAETKVEGAIITVREECGEVRPLQ